MTIFYIAMRMLTLLKCNFSNNPPPPPTLPPSNLPNDRRSYKREFATTLLIIAYKEATTFVWSLSCKCHSLSQHDGLTFELDDYCSCGLLFSTIGTKSTWEFRHFPYSR